MMLSSETVCVHVQYCYRTNRASFMPNRACFDGLIAAGTCKKTPPNGPETEVVKSFYRAGVKA